LKVNAKPASFATAFQVVDVEADDLLLGVDHSPSAASGVRGHRVGLPGRRRLAGDDDRRAGTDRDRMFRAESG